MNNVLLFDYNEIIKYEHNGKEVFVKRRLKGKHKEHCLCWQNCTYFNPADKSKNCRIANTLFEICVAFHITTPVWECPIFEPRAEKEE